MSEIDDSFTKVSIAIPKKANKKEKDLTFCTIFILAAFFIIMESALFLTYKKQELSVIDFHFKSYLNPTNKRIHEYGKIVTQATDDLLNIKIPQIMSKIRDTKCVKFDQNSSWSDLVILF